MRISQEADYAIRIVDYLSRIGENGKCDAKSIAEDTCLPKRFAVKILSKLNGAGIIKSHRGAYGGYGINRNPNDITFLEVIECIDGPTYINKCLEDTSHCSDKRGGNCNAHKKLAKVNSMICKMLSEATFEQE